MNSEQILQEYLHTFSGYSSLKSHLLLHRKEQIANQLIEILPQMICARKKHLQEIQELNGIALTKSQASLMKTCAWSTIGKTASAKGYRFILGFRNVGCSYWRKSPFHIGCFNCGFYSAVTPDIRPTLDELITQSESYFKEIAQSSKDVVNVHITTDEYN